MPITPRFITIDDIVFSIDHIVTIEPLSDIKTDNTPNSKNEYKSTYSYKGVTHTEFTAKEANKKSVITLVTGERVFVSLEPDMIYSLIHFAVNKA